MSDLKKAAEKYAKKTVKDDCPTTGDWVNIAHDFEAGAAYQREVDASIEDAENAKLRKVLDDIAHGCSHTLANEERFLHTYGKSYPDLLRDIYKRCREVLAACGDNAKEKL